LGRQGQFWWKNLLENLFENFEGRFIFFYFYWFVVVYLTALSVAQVM
jgi:hypothetical protein